MNTNAKSANDGHHRAFHNHKFATGKFNDLYNFDSSTDFAEIENKVKEITQPGKVKRCFNCVSCNKPHTQKHMSKMINVCRGCLNEAKTKGSVAQNNFINRLANDFIKSLKREVRDAQI